MYMSVDLHPLKKGGIDINRIRKGILAEDINFEEFEQMIIIIL